MKICVIIPVYEEAMAIGGIVERIRKQDMDVFVIDDGSSDNTSEVAQKAGAKVFRNEINQGKGASLIRGFEYALEQNCDAAITMDGDGQHNPADIPFFLRLAKYSESGLLIGNRMLRPKGMPLIRYLTNKFMSRLISFITRQKIPDSQCGYRLIKKEVLQKVRLLTRKYETESELIIKASRLGFKIESVPIKTIYNNSKSQINPIIDTLRFIRFIARELWNMPS